LTRDFRQYGLLCARIVNPLSIQIPIPIPPLFFGDSSGLVCKIVGNYPLDRLKKTRKYILITSMGGQLI